MTVGIGRRTGSAPATMARAGANGPNAHSATDPEFRRRTEDLTVPIVHCDILGNPWTNRGDELAAKLHALVGQVLERGRTQAWPAEDVIGSVQRILAGELDPRCPTAP